MSSEEKENINNGLGTKTQLNIYADGGCRGNPGPGGWGALIEGNKLKEERWGGEANTTNNRMELTAVIRAIETINEMALGNTAGALKLSIHTDSQYVQKGISEWIHNWKRNGWRTADKKPVKNDDLWRRLDQLAAQHSIDWRWVKGHAGHPGNERADALANRGIDEFLAKSRS
ncbi:MAG: ribonuclease HI [Pseudomonadota bacterium]